MLDHISHSQIEMWQRCPKQWEYRYVYGLKLPPSSALVLGSCYHTALEGNFRQKITTQEDLCVEDCLDLFSDAWKAKLSEEEYVDWGDQFPGDVKDEGIDLVKVYRVSTAPDIQPVKVEETYRSEIGGVELITIVDLENNKRAVIDHKTSARAYAQADVDKGLQASATAYVLGRPIVFYNHVAVKGRIPKIQIIKTYRTQADIDWWAGMVVRIVAQMRSGAAPPRPTDAFGKDGWWCNSKFCGFFERCRGECTRSYF